MDYSIAVLDQGAVLRMSRFEGGVQDLLQCVTKAGRWGSVTSRELLSALILNVVNVCNENIPFLMFSFSQDE